LRQESLCILSQKRKGACTCRLRAPNTWLQPGGEAPIPTRWLQARDMTIQENGGTAPVVARHRATPVGVVARDTARVGGIVARVVQDPAARFFRAALGHTLK